MPHVTLVDYPLQVGIRARQHSEALMREFAIIASGGGDRADVPKRLLEIAQLHRDRYSGLNPDADDAVDAANKRGEEFITLTVDAPQPLKQDTIDLGAVLLDVDRYCRDGELLTLAPPEEIRMFWIWFLSEIVNQLSGRAPVSWRDFELRPAE
jgi:hypothetical protein